MTQATPTAELAAAQTAAVRDTLANLGAELGLDVPDVGVDHTAAQLATIVVVGEPKNGKSTLVNALVGRAGLSPVDYAVATATYIAITHGSPGARVWPEGSVIPEEIHLDEVALWTSVEGLKSNPRAPKTPRPVEVTLPAPILEHVSLIDTPGVGGLVASHDNATTAALAGATALLFCVDGSAPLSEAELQFLGNATSSIAHVTFALTKIDENGSWREILAANKDLVAARAPLFKDAPWFPLAAPLAERAMQPDLAPAAAQALRERSGVDVLAAHITGELAGRAKVLASAGTMKALRSVAANFRDVAQQRLEQISNPTDEVRARLEAEQQQLESLSRIEDTWRTSLELELTNLRASEMNGLDRTVSAILGDALDLADDVGVAPAELSSFVNERLTAVSNAITERIARSISGRVTEIVGDQVDSPAFSMAMAAAENSPEVVALRTSRDLVAEGRLQPAQQMPLLMSGMGGLMFSNMALTPLIGMWAMLPGFGLAITATAVAVAFARKQATVNDRRQWVQARLNEARLDLQTVIDQRITNARVLTARAVREWIHGRVRELKGSIGELQAQQRADAESRDRARKAAVERVANIDRVIRSCDTFLAQMISAGRPAGTA